LPSDAALKSNVQTLTGSLDRVMQLNPVSYEYLYSDFPSMGLPAGTQYGFMAQELEIVRPDLVRSAMHPAEFDSTGVVTIPEVPFKAVRLEGLIPDLIAAVQELKVRNDELQLQLAQCCSNGATDSRSMQQGTGIGTAGLETDLRIIPNPVAANSQLRYTVGTPGRVRLEVSDGTGRVIEVLEESTRSTGEFTYEWNTQQLSAGTYYCTLFVNDEPLVKKAVKLNER
jgi:hypothetical protein